MTTGEKIKMLSFDGQDDYVEVDVPKSSTLETFTIETWIMAHDLDNFRAIRNNKGWSTGDIHFQFYNNKLELSINRNDPTDQWLTYSFKTNTWYHLAVTYDKNAKKVQLYVNGQFQEEKSYTSCIEAKFSSFMIAGWDGQRHFKGTIVEFRTWNYARTQVQIAADMNHPLTGKEWGLIGYWPLNEGSGSTARDLTGINNGTIKGSLWQKGDSPFPQKPGKAFLFNGEGDHVRLQEPFTGFPRTDITVEMWIKSSDTTKKGTPFSYAAAGQDNAFIIYNYNNLSVTINNEEKISTISLTDGLWHHLAVSWQSLDGVVIVHVDGKEAFRNVLARGQSITDKGSLVLGQEQDTVGGAFDVTQPFKGEMCEVRIWSTIRTTEEIVRDMCFRLTGSEPSLAGYWPMAVIEGNIVRDKTHQANDGILSGTILVDSELFLKPSSVEQMQSLREDWGRLLVEVENLNKHISTLEALNPNKENVIMLVQAHATEKANLEADKTKLTEEKEALSLAKANELAVKDNQIDALKTVNRNLITLGGYSLVITEESVSAMKGSGEVPTTIADNLLGITGSDYDLFVKAVVDKITEAEFIKYRTKIMENVKIKTRMVTMETLIDDTNAQIQNARKKLESDKSSHRLENVTMQLKMVPGSGGTGMNFPALEELPQISGSLSVINLDFTSRETTTKEEETKILIPDVSGYTEIMATRKLDAANLIAEVNYKAVDSDSDENRVVFQYPKAGEKMAPMSVVIISIGKKIIS